MSSTCTNACPAGYICLSGARHPAALDNSTISLCPPGSFCASLCGLSTANAAPYYGLLREGANLCPPGTYQVNSGSATCSPCPGGYECEGFGTVAPVPCAKGYFCSAARWSADLTLEELALANWGALQSSTYTTNKSPCAHGSYGPLANARSQADCVPCPPGKWCGVVADGANSNLGLSSPAGPCAAGYICGSGTTSSAPQGLFAGRLAYPASGGGFPTYTLDAALAATIRQSTTNLTVIGGYGTGPCPFGHYCPAGTPAPVPCEPGTYQDEFFATGCKSCPQGRYCPLPALTNYAPHALPACSAGFYCIQGANNSQPADGATGRLCAAAHYCGAGEPERPCPQGTYGPGPGLAVCPPCPPGYFCGEGASAPSPCPAGRYCPAGSNATTEGEPCPAGTYTPAQVYGLEEAA